MSIAEALREDVQRLYERVTGAPYPRDRFARARSPLPPHVDPVPYLRERLNHLKEIVGHRLNQGPKGQESLWVPIAEVREGPREYEIALEMPGVKKEHVDVQVGENVIRITGDRTVERPRDDWKVLSCERMYGPFERWITLPFRVNGKDLEFDFNDGILEIRVPKTQANSNSLESVQIG